MKNKISIKDMPPALLRRIIAQAKRILKKDKIMQDIFKKYNQSVDIIDYIPTYFKELDVSAQTSHGVVWLNTKLLADGFDKFDYSYLIHEYTHWAQQCLGDEPTKSSDDGSYLHNPYEQEGFQNQIEYISKHLGEEEAEKYVDHLLDHHDIKKKQEKDELEAILLENA